MSYEYLTPHARQCRADEIQAEREEADKAERAERLTIALEKLLDEGDYETKVEHPIYGRQVPVCELLDDYLTDYLDEPLTVARALIQHGAGSPMATQEILDGFSSWYQKELEA